MLKTAMKMDSRLRGNDGFDVVVFLGVLGAGALAVRFGF
jgi:hypothetical protein